MKWGEYCSYKEESDESWLYKWLTTQFIRFKLNWECVKNSQVSSEALKSSKFSEAVTDNWDCVKENYIEEGQCLYYEL